MVTPPVLCILQARYHSTRLPGKMLLPLGSESLIARAWRLAGEAFGADHCVVAIPQGDVSGPLGDELRSIGARIFASSRHESDVLGRFYDCAHTFRWTPDAVLVRYTPDDPFKEPELMRRVAQGERLPVELGAEAFTLAMLDAAYYRSERDSTGEREHLTPALFSHAPPAAPTDRGILTIDTEEDYLAACYQIEKGNAPVASKVTAAPKRRGHTQPAPGLAALMAR